MDTTTFCGCCLKKEKKKLKESLEFYETAEEVLSESLDSITLVKYLQQIKILCNAFFNDSMSALIPHMMILLKTKEKKD